MTNEHWIQRWEEKNIGFHEKDINSLLVKHFKTLKLTTNSRVFVPLCGKTLDISWLLMLGHDVVGVELSEIAVKELFEELHILPKISTENNGIVFLDPSGCLRWPAVPSRRQTIRTHRDVRHLRQFSRCFGHRDPRCCLACIARRAHFGSFYCRRCRTVLCMGFGEQTAPKARTIENFYRRSQRIAF